VDDRRGVLKADALGRNHKWDDRHFGVFFVFRLAAGISQNPLMRDGFVAKLGAYLDRVGRHLGAEDTIAVSHIAVRHGVVLRFSFRDGLVACFIWRWSIALAIQGGTNKSCKCSS